MTNDEAIKGLKTIRTVHNGNYAEHIDYAIKALEQQPCEDYISREEALKVMCDNCPMYNCVCGCSSYRHIERMASVTPKAEWIPCDERLPEREGWYLTSFDKTYGGADVDMYYKGWVKYGTHVLAWMPLPEPYKIPAQTFGCAED